MQISKRLKAIADLIKPNSKVIDIACDHGLLGIYLLVNNISKQVLLTDISDNALNSAKQNALKYRVKPLFRVTDGLNNIDYVDYDTIVIAGLGSEQIINIINNRHLTQQLIVVTHSNTYQLRKYMQDNGYKLNSEILINENNKYYFVMEYYLGKSNYGFKSLFLSPIQSINNHIYKQYLNELLIKYHKIYKQIPIRYLFKKIYYGYLNYIIKKALR